MSRVLSELERECGCSYGAKPLALDRSTAFRRRGQRGLPESRGETEAMAQYTVRMDLSYMYEVEASSQLEAEEQVLEDWRRRQPNDVTVHAAYALDPETGEPLTGDVVG